MSESQLIETHSVLVVDDEPEIAELIDVTLTDQGYKTHCVFNGSDAIQYVKTRGPELVMLDVRLPDLNGLEVLKALKQINPELKVIMITAHGTIKLATECMRVGAYDFVEKPFTLDELETTVKRVFEDYEFPKAVLKDRGALENDEKFEHMIGRSQKAARVVQEVAIAARSGVSVLLRGESGTGKEIVARAIHNRSLHANGSFIAVNCGAIPDALLESELYGHEKGSFTGAVSRQIGKFEQAQKGTIFLDEIGDLNLHLQIKLLRVLQERSIERIGGSELIKISARFISATNKNLEKLVHEHKFREDLYYRINVFPIYLPSLRERREDIPELLKYFFSVCSGGHRSLGISEKALARLMAYDWPGNLRELENFAERCLLLKGNQEWITEEDIESLHVVPSEKEAAAPVENLNEAEKAVLEKVLFKFNGNVSKTCQFLSISRDTFYRKARKYSIKIKRFIHRSS